MNLEYYEKLSKMIEFKDGKPYWIKCVRSDWLGKLAGSLKSNGYRQISTRINGALKNIPAHRLAWFMEYGYLPEEVDHINRKTDDNRIKNLRDVTRSQNMRNVRGKGSSSFVGVSWNKKDQVWRARCQINKVEHYIGSYNCEIEAAKAYNKFCIKMNLKTANLNLLN